MQQKLCIGVAEMAVRLGISQSGAYNIARSSGFYPAKRLGKRIVVCVEELELWLKEQGKTNVGEGR